MCRGILFFGALALAWLGAGPALAASQQQWISSIDRFSSEDALILGSHYSRALRFTSEGAVSGSTAQLRLCLGGIYVGVTHRPEMADQGITESLVLDLARRAVTNLGVTDLAMIDPATCGVVSPGRWDLLLIDKDSLAEALATGRGLADPGTGNVPFSAVTHIAFAEMVAEADRLKRLAEEDARRRAAEEEETRQKAAGAWDEAQKELEAKKMEAERIAAERRSRALAGDVEEALKLAGEAKATGFREGELNWRRVAADFDHADSMVVIALHEHEVGNVEGAKAWFGKLALAGDVRGMEGMGFCLEQPEGSAEDNAEAFMWYDRAISMGSKDAASRKQVIMNRIAARESIAKFGAALRTGDRPAEFGIAGYEIEGIEDNGMNRVYSRGKIGGDAIVFLWNGDEHKAEDRGLYRLVGDEIRYPISWKDDRCFEIDVIQGQGNEIFDVLADAVRETAEDGGRMVEARRGSGCVVDAGRIRIEWYGDIYFVGGAVKELRQAGQCPNYHKFLDACPMPRFYETIVIDVPAFR